MDIFRTLSAKIPLVNQFDTGISFCVQKRGMKRFFFLLIYVRTPIINFALATMIFDVKPLFCLSKSLADFGKLESGANYFLRRRHS